MSKYELFDAKNYCDIALPLNVIQDEFTIVRFSPILIQEGTNTHSAVLPRDIVNPKLMADVLYAVRKLPYKVDLPVLRGGISLNPDWEDWTAPAEPETKKVVIPDRNKFFSDPKIEIDGETYEPHLSPENFYELMTHGNTVVTVGENGSMRFVELSAGGAALDCIPDLAKDIIPINNLYEFLSDPKIKLGSYGTYKVSLTEKNVEELTTIGVSQVEVIQGSSKASIYVTTSHPSTPGEVITYRSGMYPYEMDQSIPPMQAELTVPQLQLHLIAMLPNFELVLYLPYRQTWELLGYSRGEMLNSISLGPQEETTIEVFNWDRVKRTQEDTDTQEQEGTMDVSFTDKDSYETLKETAKKNHWNFSHSGEISIPIEEVKIKASHTFDIGEEINNLDRTTHQTISEAVRKASVRIKTSRQTKISESQEVGSEEKVTRKIKNANMCHTLNLDYFEILASYKVTTQLALDQVQLCVLSDISIPTHIDMYFLLVYEGALRDALLSKVYLPGFDAARKLLAWGKLCAIKCLAPCPCEKPAEQAAATSAGTPTTTADATAVANAAAYLRERIKALANASSSTIVNLISDYGRWLKSIAPEWLGGMNATEKQAYDKEWEQAKTEFHRWLYRKTAMESLSLRFWNTALEFGNSTDTKPETLERMLNAADPNILADVFNLALVAVQAHTKALEIIWEVLGTVLTNPKPLIENIGFDDAGLGTAFKQARSALDAYKSAEAARSQSSGSTTTKDAKKETEGVLEQATSDYSPTEIAEAYVAVEALANHIDQNYAYYREAIWRQLGSNDRLLSLRVQGNLSTRVHNDVLGFVGYKVAMPYRMSDDANAQQWLKENILDNTELKKLNTPTTITLPSKGVMMETRLGQCDACEDFIVKHRDLDLQQKAAEVKVVEEHAKQEQHETERYKKRLTAAQPMLDDPDPHQNDRAVHVVIEKTE